MTDKTLSVRIVASDGASKTFATVATSADKMGDAIDKAGDEGSKSLKQIDTQSKTTAASMSTVTDRALAMGAALGTLAAGIAVVGRNSRDAQNQIDAISRAYGDQADIIFDLTERVQDYSRFSNDSAREASLTFQTLTDNYGISLGQLDDLMIRSADVAQLRGRTLEEVSAMLSAAARGEAEYAEAVGVSLQDQYVASEYAARGLGNWNTVVDEAAKAQFRFQLIMEQTAYASGAASEAVESAGGRFRQFINNADDAAESIGNFLGPVGQVAAEMAPIAVALPVVGAGLGKVNTALAGTAIAGRAASLALGPVGVAIAGITVLAAAGVIGWNIYNDALTSSARSLEDFLDIANEAELSGDNKLAGFFRDAATELDEFRNTVQKVRQENTGSNGFANFPRINGDIDEIWNTTLANIEANLQDSRINQQAYFDWVAQQIAFAESILNNPDLLRANPNIVNETMDRINNVDLTKFIAEVNDATLALEMLDAASAAAAATFEVLNRAAGSDFASGMIAGAQAAADAGVRQAETLEAFNDATIAYLENGDNILDWWLEYDKAVNQGAASFSGTQEQYEQFLAVLEQEASFRSLVDLADNLNDAGDSLDRMLNVFSQIDALGQRSESAGSIAEALVGEPGVWDEIDDMLAAGTISQEEYNSAVAAGHEIQRSNLRVQEDLNSMRRAQLPLLQEEQAAYEAQIEAISQLPPLEQRRALALQDSAIQSQLAAQYATAYSASIGEIPTEVATNMIVSAAEADPVLKDLLLQFGLIEEGADGTISVSFPDGPTVQETIVGLTDAIDRLFLQLGGDPAELRITAVDEATPVVEQAISNATSYDGTTVTSYLHGDNSNAIGAINEATGALNQADGQTANVTITATDMASGVIGGVLGALAAIPRSISTTVYTNRVTTGGFGPAQLQGGVPGFQNGGLVPFYAGENNRPELARFANGGTAVIPHEGYYAAPPMTRIVPNNGNSYGGGGGNSYTFVIQGSVVTEKELIGKAAMAVWQTEAEEAFRDRLEAGVL